MASRMERAGRGSLFGLAGWALPVAVTSLSMPFILRWLSPEEYGLQVLVATVVGYSALLELGLNEAGTKYVAEYVAHGEYEKVNRLLSANLLILGGFGLVAGLAIFLAAEWLATKAFSIPPHLLGQAVIIFRIAGPALFAQMILWWFTSIPNGLQRFGILNGMNIAVSTSTAFAGLVTVGLGFGVVGLVAANFAVTVLALLAYTFVLRCMLPSFRIRYALDREMIRAVLLYAGPGLGTRVLGIVMIQVERTLIGMWLGVAAMSFYAVPYSIARYVNVIAERTFQQVVMPMVSEMQSLGEETKLHTLYLKATKWSVMFSTMLAVPVLTFAPWILRLYAGEQYMSSEATLVLILLAIRFYLTSLVSPSYAFVMGGGYPKMNFLSSCIIVPINVLTNVLLIPSLGIVAAGVANVTSMLGLWPLFHTAINSVAKVRARDLVVVYARIAAVACPFVVSNLFFIDQLSLSYSLWTLVGLALSVELCLALIFYLQFVDADERRLVARVLLIIK